MPHSGTSQGVEGRLAKTLTTSNPVESMISIARSTNRNVSRWRDGQMVLRWTAAGMLDAERSFRRIKGYKQMPQLVAALYRHAHPDTARGAEASVPPPRIRSGSPPTAGAAARCSTDPNSAASLAGLGALLLAHPHLQDVEINPRVTATGLNGLALSRDTPVGMRRLVIASRDDLRVAHDGSAGLSPRAGCPIGCRWGR